MQKSCISKFTNILIVLLGFLLSIIILTNKVQANIVTLPKSAPGKTPRAGQVLFKDIEIATGENIIKSMGKMEISNLFVTIMKLTISSSKITTKVICQIDKNDKIVEFLVGSLKYRCTYRNGKLELVESNPYATWPQSKLKDELDRKITNTDDAKSVMQILELIPDSNKNWALYRAAVCGRDKIVSAVLQLSGINPHDSSQDPEFPGETPLMAAVDNNHTTVVQILVNHDPTLMSDTDLSGHDAFRHVLDQDQTSERRKIFDVMLSKVSDLSQINRKYAGNYNLAHIYAQIPKCIQQFKALLRHGGQVDAINDCGRTALHEAAMCGNLEAVKAILSNAPNPHWIDQQDIKGNTTLTLACQEGFFEIADILIKNGAGVNVPNLENVTPLYFACQNGYFNIVQLLINSHADVNASCFKDCYPISIAAYKGYIEIIDFLIHQNADVNLGCIPLPYLVKNKNVDIISKLLEAGCCKFNLNSDDFQVVTQENLNEFIVDNPDHKEESNKIKSQLNSGVDKVTVLKKSSFCNAIKENNIQILELFLKHPAFQSLNYNGIPAEIIMALQLKKRLPFEFLLKNINVENIDALIEISKESLSDGEDNWALSILQEHFQLPTNNTEDQQNFEEEPEEEVEPEEIAQPIDFQSEEDVVSDILSQADSVQPEVVESPVRNISTQTSSTMSSRDIELMINNQAIEYERLRSMFNLKRHFPWQIDIHTNGRHVNSREFIQLCCESIRQNAERMLFTGLGEIIVGQGNARGFSPNKHSLIRYLRAEHIRFYQHSTNPGRICIKFRDGQPERY
ncbi:MAG: ankyrin repeat domain-containing protein [Lactobacillales bacterium]|nr:ankyrin repeat domain-containing protein [Lactobacillales bacterium]